MGFAASFGELSSAKTTLIMEKQEINDNARVARNKTANILFVLGKVSPFHGFFGLTCIISYERLLLISDEESLCRLKRVPIEKLRIPSLMIV